MTHILEFQKKKEKLTQFAFKGGLEESPSERLEVSLATTLLEYLATYMTQELKFILHSS